MRTKIAEWEYEELGYAALRAFDLNPRAVSKETLRSAGRYLYDAAQGIETRSAIDPKGRGPKDESPVA